MGAVGQNARGHGPIGKSVQERQSRDGGNAPRSALCIVGMHLDDDGATQNGIILTGIVWRWYFEEAIAAEPKRLAGAALVAP